MRGCGKGRSNFNYQGNRSPNILYCSFCKRNEHNDAQCWNKNRNMNNFCCTYSKKNGHDDAHCWRKKEI